MRRSLGVLAAVLFLAGSAHGGIGDTEEQARMHYGDPIALLPARSGEAGLTKCYSSKGYLVAVTFLKGHSAREMLAKADNSTITASEIRNLLDRTSDSPWIVQQLAGPKNITAGVQQWRSTDQRSRVAIYDSQTRALFITTQQFINLTNAQTHRRTLRANTAEGLGPRGRPQQGLGGILDRGSAISALRRDQPKPAATPAK